MSPLWAHPPSDHCFLFHEPHFQWHHRLGAKPSAHGPLEDIKDTKAIKLSLALGSLLIRGSHRAKEVACSLFFLSFQNQVRGKRVEAALFLFWIYSGRASNAVSFFLVVKPLCLFFPELCRASCMVAWCMVEGYQAGDSACRSCKSKTGCRSKSLHRQCWAPLAPRTALPACLTYP